MATFQSDLELLELTDIELHSNAEVQLLADLLGGRGEALVRLHLKRLIPVVKDDMAGFLDPILLAMQSSSEANYPKPSFFELSGSDSVSRSGVSLISEAALCRFLPCVDFSARNQWALFLKGLGLGDSHAKLIAELLPTVNARTVQGKSASLSLNFQSNPAIGLSGYEALLCMLNRGSAIEQIMVDDADWTAKYKIVVDMNIKYGRGGFMEGGVFPDRVTWMDWVIRLAKVAPVKDVKMCDTGQEEEVQDDETRQLNYIWYTLLEKPDFISN
jgi:hypothetical protein